jgi:signal peptidase I
MYNTLVDGDYLLIVSNVLYGDPQPGDVIVASKDSFRNGEAIVKRVIATEGQEIDIDFSTGSVYVDGKLIEEPYIFSATTDSEGMTFPLVVDEGCLFVMGDNRAVSMDSRDPQIGLIDCREVVGKAVFLIFPGNNKDKSERQLYRIGVIG